MDVVKLHNNLIYINLEVVSILQEVKYNWVIKHF